MHKTAIEDGQKFYNKYISHRTGLKVLDVGSMNVKNQAQKLGSFRNIFKEHNFIGLDIAKGDNVDMIYDGQKIPFGNESIDVVVSTSCMEHNPTFWITFAEMVRIVKKDGLIYLNAPSAGHIHNYPVDCYRFYPDAWQGLADWAGIKLIEQYINLDCYWKNNVGIFSKI